MQYVQLLVDVDRTGNDLEAQKAKAQSFGISPQNKHYPRLDERVIFGERVEFRKGAKIPLSDASAEKFVERKVAIVCDPDPVK